MKPINMLSFGLVFILVFSTGNLTAQDQSEISVTLIKAGKVFDSQSGKLLEEQQILVEKNLIKEVGKKIGLPENAKIIDLSNLIILPGLIDAHTHLLYLESLKSDLSTEGLKSIVHEGASLRALRGGARAKTFLNAGITTVKDLGNSGQFIDVALKKAINEGTIDGPRMFVSGPILSSEGGQFPGLLKEHRHLAELEYRVIKGPHDAINAVRENITYGADLIKICANNTPNPTSLTIEEMKAIVKTAHRYHKKVTAHATDNQSVWDAVMAGVDGIEHGYSIDDSTLKLMASKGVILIPTDISRGLIEKYFELSEFQGDRDAVLSQWLKSSHDRLQRALKAGVIIVAGSDNYLDFKMPQGEAAKNVLIAYFEAAMEPVEIIKAATINSARFLGREDKLGIIKPGAYADIIAVNGDIEKDFQTSIFNIDFVMKNGKIYKNNN